MNRLIAVAAFAVAMTGAAFAQDNTQQNTQENTAPTTSVAMPAQAAAPAFATACPTLPAAPAIPDGATARERDMAAADAALQAWNGEYVTIINGCRQDEVRAVQAEMEAAVAAARAAQARYQAAIGAYQADSAVATTVAAQWGAEVEEFNNR